MSEVCFKAGDKYIRYYGKDFCSRDCDYAKNFYFKPNCMLMKDASIKLPIAKNPDGYQGYCRNWLCKETERLNKLIREVPVQDFTFKRDLSGQWRSHADLHKQYGEIKMQSHNIKRFIDAIPEMKNGKVFTNGEYYYKIAGGQFCFGELDEDLIEWGEDSRELHDLIISNIEVYEHAVCKEPKMQTFYKLYCMDGDGDLESVDNYWYNNKYDALKHLGKLTERYVLEEKTVEVLCK